MSNNRTSTFRAGKQKIDKDRDSEEDMETESADLTSPLVEIRDGGGEAALRASSSSTAEDIKAEIAKLTAKLAKALPLTSNESGLDKDGGYVDVDFVRTKPGLASVLARKQSNVKTILHDFRAVRDFDPLSEGIPSS